MRRPPIQAGEEGSWGAVGSLRNCTHSESMDIWRTHVLKMVSIVSQKKEVFKFFFIFLYSYVGLLRTLLHFLESYRREIKSTTQKS